jgi:exodeoxyribonuclease VII small subunit
MEKISYEKAVSELEDIVNKIESEEISVDELSEKVKRASELIRICKAKLFSTEKEVNKILDEIPESETTL